MVKIFDDWSMFSPKGNIRMVKLAQDFVDELGDITQVTIEQFKIASTNYIQKWKKLTNTKAYGECGDTAVRELVLAFVEDVGQEITVPAYININVLIRQVIENAYWSN